MSTVIVKYRGALLAGTALGLFCLGSAHAQTVTNPTIATCVEDVVNAQFACGSNSSATPGTNATAVGNTATANFTNSTAYGAAATAGGVDTTAIGTPAGVGSA